MLNNILTQVTAHIQLITAALILAAVVLELVHIVQTRRINKRLKYALHWLQRYLNAVFADEAADEAYDAEDAEGTELAQERNEAEANAAIRSAKKSGAKDADKQLANAKTLKSRQEENMRSTLSQKKQRKDEELLDTVLQEIFD